MFRAVPVPAGEHEVELRFESRTLQFGLGISAVAYAVLALLVVGPRLLDRARRGALPGNPAARP
jgi:hypothetical protein